MTATVLSTELAEAAAKDVILARCGYSFGIGKHVGAWLRATADHIVSADAEIAELRRDAERYRWLRANATRKLGAELFGQPCPSYIDKAIDAARGGE